MPSTCARCVFRVSQAGKEGDELLVVHVSKSKEKEKEKNWDHGSAVIADLHTALQPYKHDVYDLEVSGRAGVTCSGLRGACSRWCAAHI